METILKQILKEKTNEIVKMKRNRVTTKRRYEYHSFIEKITTTEQLLVIGEFKRASPSKGMINATVDPLEQALMYVRNGASAISILTERTFFKGTFADLRLIREHVSVPILCKDFIIDEVQIDAANDAGADIILLIVAALKPERLIQLYRYAIDRKLEVLIEVHDESELELAFQTGTKMIGVNNRDLNTFQVDIETTEKLAPHIIAEGIHFISESGLATVHDIERVAAAGARAVLIGETFMTNNNPGTIIQQFSQISLTGVGK